MKNKFSAAAAAAIVCCLLTISGFMAGAVSVSAENDTVDEVEHLINGIISYQTHETDDPSPQKWLDGELREGVGADSEWFVIALRQYDAALDFSSYADALESFLENNSVAGAASRQKYALALVASGRSDNEFVRTTLNDSIGEQGIMSWVFGLHLLNNGLESSAHSSQDVIARLLSLRLSDGGWSLMGTNSDIDVTAMTVQALAPYYASDLDVKSAVDEAVAMLSDKQLGSGGYSSYGTENPESAAQVIVALSSVGIDPPGDSRFIKNGNSMLDGLFKYRLSDGSFSRSEGGTSDASATMQAFYALIAIWRTESGLGPLYVFDNPSESIPPEVPQQADPADTAAPAAPSDEPGGHGTESLPGYIIWATIVIIAVALLVSLIFWLIKKRRFKN